MWPKIQAVTRSLAFPAIFIVSSAARILALDPTSHISQYGHSVWRVQDGYFGGEPRAIAQTTDGYIWVGTDAGLFQFDGIQFVRWNAPSGEELPSSSIHALLGARDGSLWIGTDAGLAHLVNKRLILYQRGWHVSTIMEDRDRSIWITDTRADDQTHPLCQILESEVHCYGTQEGLDVFGAGPIAQDASGDLWVGSERTLVRWRAGASKVYRPKALQSNEGVDGVGAITLSADGSLWVGIAVPEKAGACST